MVILFVSLQDIGVQGYSTLHCIRFRGVEVRMDKSLQYAAGNLGAMPARTLSEPGESIQCTLDYTCVLKECTCVLVHICIIMMMRKCVQCDDVITTIPPPLSLSLSPPLLPPLATRPAHHRFYVYCKSPCNAMRPGKLRVRCADCKDTSFVLLGVCYTCF